MVERHYIGRPILCFWIRQTLFEMDVIGNDCPPCGQFLLNSSLTFNSIFCRAKCLTSKGGLKMGKKILVLLFVVIFVFIPNLVLADCVDISRFTNWLLEGDHTITLYSGRMPVAVLQIPYCTIRPSSSIRFTKSYLCDGDNIFIDGSECMIISLESVH